MKLPNDVAEITVSERKTAQAWLDFRIREKSGLAWISFPEEWLPATGLAVHRPDGSLLAAAFLYFAADTPVAYCGWCTADPDGVPFETVPAVRKLMTALPEYAAANGAEWLFAVFAHSGINRILESAGYVKGETAINYCMKLKR